MPELLLPTASSGNAPEPWWMEHDFALSVTAAGPVPAVAPPVETQDLDAPLHQLGVAALRNAYACGRTDPVAVLAALRTRMQHHPVARQAVLAAIDGADALAEDSSLRFASGNARALEGIPFGVKDIIDVAGAPVTCGSWLTDARVASADASVVTRLRQAGAIPIVMLATTEFACGSAHNARYSAVRNPWEAGRWTGGSSTGSGAALASRLLPLALGSDTGGSIRIPSAWCGTTGLKPTRGLVARTGVTSLSWTLDHVGPMARSAADLALVMPCLSGPDGRDGLAAGSYDAARARYDIAGLRVGVPGGWFLELLDDAVLAAWRAALASISAAGATLVPVDLGDIATAHDDGYRVMFCELASLQEPDFDRIGECDAGTRGRIEQGRAMSALDYIRALRRRPLVLRRILAAMDGVDVLVTPGVGGEAGFLSDLTVEVNAIRHPLHEVAAHNTMIFDYTGQPALMLPSGRGRTGLPVAIQIVGRPYDDALCLSVGAAFQKLTDHHRAMPPEALV